MIIVIVLAVIGFGIFMILMLAGIGKGASKGRAQALADQDRIYSELFDGRQTVVYVSHDAALPVDAVTAAADQRNYDVVSVQPGGVGFNANTITFSRRADGETRDA